MPDFNTNESSKSNTREDEISRVLDLVQKRRANILAFVAHIEPKARRLTNVNIVCGGLAAAVTITPVLGEKTIMEALGDSGPGSLVWNLILILAFVLSMISTIAASLYKSRDIAGQLAKAQTTGARLASLEAQLKLEKCEPTQIFEKYKAMSEDIFFVPDEKSIAAIVRAHGSIEAPKNKQKVEYAIFCSGYAKDIYPGCHLWLVVEIKGQIWPKDEIYVGEKGKGHWNSVVQQESKKRGQFALAFYAADEKAHQQIENWMEKGNKDSNYEGLHKPSFLKQLDVVTGLHLNQQRGLVSRIVRLVQPRKRRFRATKAVKAAREKRAEPPNQ